MEKAEVLMWDFKKVLTEVYEVKSFLNWLCAQAVINSSVFGMNGFMSEALENPEGLSFGNMDNFVDGFK